MTPPPPNIRITPPLMIPRMILGQGAQCFVILNNLRSYTIVSVHLPNPLLMQRLGNLRVTHQSQVTRYGLSYKAFFFSSAIVPMETFHSAKRFAVIW